MRKQLVMWVGGLAFAGSVALLSITSVAPIAASDHLDAPDLTPPGGNLMADLADLYVFPAPGKKNQVVLIATYNPAAGIFGPEGFDPSVIYELNVTNDGNTRADVRYTVTFEAPGANGRQEFSVSRNGTVVASGKTGTPTMMDPGAGRVFADLVDDPFFFDLDAFLASGGRAFCDGDETDFFAGLNVNAIVLQVPLDELADGPFGTWASTRKMGKNAKGGQIDRVGFPAITTVFIPKNRKNQYNDGQPKDDVANYTRFLRRAFKANGNTTATAKALAGALLPDILPYDPSAVAGFLNGRLLADDVIDAELGLLTAGALAGDCVDANDAAFLDKFPYLADAH